MKPTRNIVAAVTQVLVTGITFFLLYRFLYFRLGVEEIGVWSIVLASVAVSRLGDFGLSIALVRHVAKAIKEDDPQLAAVTIESASIALAVLLAMVLGVLAVPLSILLKHAVDPKSLPLAQQILPYALLSLWLSMIASIYQGALDGFQRIDLRGAVVSASAVFYLLLTIQLVPEHGLLGVAYANVAQAAGSAILAWVLLRRVARSLPIAPWRCRWSVLKPLLRFGLNIQLIGLMSILFDPVVKLLMSKVGGVASVGYYEMANKLVLQLRAFIVEANRVIVPIVAGAGEQLKSERGSFFLGTYRVVFFVSVASFSALGLLLPLVSIAWTGSYRSDLVRYGLILVVGWFVNTLVGPAFFQNLGSGQLRHNVRSQMIIGLGAVGFGAVGGFAMGADGVVLGSAIALITGSLYLLRSKVRELGLSWPGSLIPRGGFTVLVPAIGVATVSNLAIPGLDTVMALSASTLLLLGWLIFVSMQPTFRDLLRSVQS